MSLAYGWLPYLRDNFIVTGEMNCMMKKVVRATHRKNGKVYAWLLPEGMAVPPPGSWVLVENRDSHAAVRVRDVREAEEPCPSQKVVKRIESVEELCAYRERQDNGLLNTSFAAESRRWQNCGLDMEPYWKAGYQVRQLRQLRMALAMGLRIDGFSDPIIPANRMESLRWKEMARVAKALGLIPQRLSKRQQKELLYGLQQGVDITLFNDPALSWRQMRDVRLCLKRGIPAAEIKGLSHKELTRLCAEWQEQEN